jgi:peptidoglycan/xylan/chitin deacetylase (PgdA/CDA1 family)
MADWNQGIGQDFCRVPQICQRKYGRCDSDATPAGMTTLLGPRPIPGPVPYGSPLKKCKTPGTVAITFDDGPSEYTSQILDMLDAANAKATFFVNGITNGKGEIDLMPKWINDIHRMNSNGHQIASHTWSHADLDKTSSEGRRKEMSKNEMALNNIIGKFPTYMRAPYIKCSGKSGCLEDMKRLGYHVVDWTVDTTDTVKPKDFNAMKSAVDAGLAKSAKSGSLILIQHDTVHMSALELTKYVLEEIQRRKWKAVTVAECLGEPLEDAYRRQTVVQSIP